MVCLMNLTLYSSLDSYTSRDEEKLTKESISTGMHVVNSCEPRMLVLAISVVSCVQLLIVYLMDGLVVKVFVISKQLCTASVLQRSP